MVDRDNPKNRRSGPGKPERYIQPSILLALSERQSHGYELIKTIQEFGFIQGQAPPGMVYRHLRQLEEEGLVSSTWNTQEGGPAKRIYRTTFEGEEVLRAWVEYMKGQAEALQNFIWRFQQLRD